jgi:hypothetical protein
MTLSVTLIVAVAPTQATTIILKGVKAGLNLATLTGDDADDAKTRAGLAAGGFVKVSLTPAFSVQPEVLYSMKGAKFEESSADDFTIKLDYIEVPVLLQYNIPTQGNVKPVLFAGPAVAFNMSAKLEGTIDSASADVDIDNVKSVDIGIAAGAGVELKSGTTTFGFEARYTLGLGNVLDDVSNPGSNDLVDPSTGSAFDVKNSAISILAFVGF